MSRLREVLPTSGMADDLFWGTEGTAGRDLQVCCMRGEEWIVPAAGRDKAGMLVREPNT